MFNLDDLEQLKKLDPKDVLGSTGMFAKQCLYIWEQAKTVQFEEKQKNKKNIVLCAMGGSGYGAYVTQNLFHDELKVPLIRYNDYHLPGFVNQDSLVILSSYSGGTEEPLNCASEAIERSISLTALTGGGKALELSKTYNFPSLTFDTKYNPSAQPRLGMGYMIVGVIALLTRLGYLKVSDEEIKQAVEELEANSENLQNQAKTLAKKIYGNIPLYFAAEFLKGNAHIIRNQTNETAKSFAAFSELPELNHHLMEGLKNPSDKKLIAVFINSALYSDKLKKRLQLTQDVVEKNGIPFIEYTPAGSTKLSQVLNTLSFGGYLTFYLAMLYGQDPSVIPWVDYFKQQLEK